MPKREKTGKPELDYKHKKPAVRASEPDSKLEAENKTELACEPTGKPEEKCKCENPYKPKPYKILEVTRLTADISTFRVEADTVPAFGQFFQLSVPSVGEGPFSISGVGDGWLDFTIRSVGELTACIHKKRIGDTIFIRGPYGNGFSLKGFKGKHLVIAAGGGGISPLRPLIEYYYQNENEVDKLDILLGFRTPNDILFLEDIERWRNKFNIILTVDYACGEWDNEYIGLITKYIKDIKFSKFHKMDIVIVGPPIMMKFTAKEFIDRGVPGDRILLSYERKMSCGIGKCGHCKISDSYVCVDGPVFRYSEASTLID